MASFRYLLPPTYRSDVQNWVREDCPSFDVGGFVVGEKEETAHLLCKSSGVLAGVPFAEAVFDYLDVKYIWHVEEGQVIDVHKASTQKPGEAPPSSSSSSSSQPPYSSGKVCVATITGKCRNILLAERTALNILSRASGVATQARQAADVKDAMKWHGFVAGTRKTTPGFGKVEKYALVVGGIATHRLDLSQMVMLKDNHIWSAGNITNAVKKARTAAGFSSKIEVECQSVEEAHEAAEAGADIVMLDNFTIDTIKAAAEAVKTVYPHVLVEASGGITGETMEYFMHSSVDIISRGTFTQGYSVLDYSLKIVQQ